MDITKIDRAGFYPFNEITKEQPFPNGTGGCEGFRIPGLIRLADGRLFATTDARWSDPDSDYGGIDTMYAVSGDNGKTWSHGYAAYFPDSLGTPSDPNEATVCIDSCPAETTDGVIHIFVNLGPSGVTTGLCDPNPGTGYITVDGVRRLALTDDYSKADNAPDAFGYYVGDFTGGFAPIMKITGEQTGYVIDEFFNIYSTGAERRAQSAERTAQNDDQRVTETATDDELVTRNSYIVTKPLYQNQIDTGATIVQNIFYKASAFHIFNTMHVLHVYTEDINAGWHWELVTDMVKLESENASIISPGNGIVTKSGATILPFYSPVGISRAFLAISDDNCRTFTRSPYIPVTDDIPWSGESKPVELPDGNIRLFFRNGTRRVCYADYDISAGQWKTPVKLPVLVHSECNFGAMITGAQSTECRVQSDPAPCTQHPAHIYISHIRGRGDDARNRARGRIYDFMLDENNEMVLRDVFDITEGYFSYSVIIPHSDHTAAVLYDTCEHGVVRFETVEVPEE